MSASPERTRGIAVTLAPRQKKRGKRRPGGPPPSGGAGCSERYAVHPRGQLREGRAEAREKREVRAPSGHCPILGKPARGLSSLRDDARRRPFVLLHRRARGVADVDSRVRGA